MSGIPRLSHLQFLVAGILRGRALPGRTLRDELFGLHVFGTYMACMPVVVPQLFLRRGRLTRFSKLVAWTAFALFIGWIAVLRLSGPYAGG